MKKLIALLVAGSISCFFVAKAAEVIRINPLECLGTFDTGGGINKTRVTSTKISTEEGLYRVFLATSYYGVGITAVKIK